MAFLSLPAQLTSPLDAVNTMISTLGKSRVTTLDPPPTADAADALARLNEVDLEVQTRGWHWNREYSYQLTLNGDGTVSLPDETLSVMQAYASAASSPGTPLNITQRGSILYDLVGHTNVFTVAPVVDIIVRLDWDSLPQAARSYIALEACDRFQAPRAGNQIVLQVNSQSKAKAWTLLEQREDETAGVNSVNGSVNVISALYGLGGLRRNRGGF